jgi:hypothetical protein
LFLVCREKRLTKRGLLKDIAADSAVIRLRVAGYPAGTVRSSLNSWSEFFMEEVSMYRVNVVAVAAVVTLGFLSGFAIPVSAQSVTAFEGARLIVGDGNAPIENATLVIEGTKIVLVGHGTIEVYPGTYEQFLWSRKERAAGATQPAPSVGASGSGSSRRTCCPTQGRRPRQAG